MNWHYLSFADGSLPEGTQFLGAVIVEAEDFGAAVAKAHALKINPGGEVMGFTGVPTPLEGYANRLLSKTDLIEMDRKLGFEGGPKTLDELEAEGYEF